MRELMQHSELRAEMSRHAMRVVEDFSIEKVMTIWKNALESS